MQVISFSGLDGAGKTTQIKLLHNYLTQRGKRISILTMYDDISVARRIRKFFSLKRLRSNNFSSETRIHNKSQSFRKDKNTFSLSKLILRMLTYLLDSISLHIAIWKHKNKYDIIIFDRYIYDSLVNLLTYTEHPIVKYYIHVLCLLSPRPDTIIFLSTTPEIAFARKPEYPKEYLKKRYVAYKKMFSSYIKDAIFADGQIEETFSKIKEEINAFTTKK